MADEDDLYYLQPGFDLNTLTVPRLRNILVAHNVSYLSSAKKSQLVEQVESDILPKAKKLLRERDRVRRTSKGITDMSSQDGTVEADEDPDRELMPPPPAPKTPRSRKSKSNLGDAATSSTSRRSKTPSTRKSTPRTKASDTETDGERPQSSAKKSRKSAPEPAAPSVRLEEPVRVKREAGSSPFSDDNPFQSGSPPAEPRRTSSSSNRRKSQGRQSTSRRRETTSPVIKREDDTSYASYRFPLSQVSDDISTTEEFTEDAARELEHEQANGQLVPKRSQALVRKRKKPTSTTAKSAPALILMAVIGAIATWYRQEKVNIGYCGVGKPTWSLSSNPNIPAWVHENLQPTCEPCPPHAVCSSNMEAKCEDDFVLQHHPLNLNGLLPIPPTCEPDSEKERKIKAVADRAIEELRERRAAYECGDRLVSEEVKTVAKASETKLKVAEETLKEEVKKLKRRGMSGQEFEDLWRGALEDVMARDEVEVTRDGYVPFPYTILRMTD